MASRRVLVYGLGVSGSAVARCLAAEGARVVAADDDGSARTRRRAAELGVELEVAPSAARLEELAAGVDEVVVSPGIAVRHRVFALEGTVPLVGEVEVAWRRARAPLVAVTGTNGKTTVTTLAVAMLRASGVRAAAAGNIGTPLLDAVAGDAEVIVAEVSSFQLALTQRFRPAVGAWVNFSADHLDWHPTLDHYRAAKARLWANAGPGDVAVANAEDPVVMDGTELPDGRGATVVTFGLDRGDYRVREGRLLAPDGTLLATAAELPRSFPHDLADGLCAAAAAIAAGAAPEGCRRALSEFRGLPHRLELVGEAGGVRYFDDSKATTPGAVVAALEGFETAVLIAGGRNKGLDLWPLAAVSDRLRAVVAIGEAAPQVAAVFAGSCPVTTAASMEQAVRDAAAAARPGDAVVLSPACASFDWYPSYGARGDDFARCVRALTAAGLPSERAPR